MYTVDIRSKKFVEIFVIDINSILCNVNICRYINDVMPQNRKIEPLRN